MINNVILLGRVGRDMEISYTQSGVAIGKFSVATSENYKKDGGWVEKTTWHNIVLFSKMAEALADKIKKGSMVYVEGLIQIDKWEDKQGNKKSSTSIKASRVKVLDSSNKQESKEPTFDQGDIPF